MKTKENKKSLGNHGKAQQRVGRHEKHRKVHVRQSVELKTRGFLERHGKEQKRVAKIENTGNVLLNRLPFPQVILIFFGILDGKALVRDPLVDLFFDLIGAVRQI